MVLLPERNTAVRERLLRVIHSAGHAVESFSGGRPLLWRLSVVEESCCAVADLVGLREAS